MTIAGGRHDLVIDNTFSGNKAWGILLRALSGDRRTAAAGPRRRPLSRRDRIGQRRKRTCCYFDDYANEIASNTFANNGGYGNPTNGDIGEVSNPEADGNCWHGNIEVGGGAPTSDPLGIETTHGTCGQPNSGEPASSVLGVAGDLRLAAAGRMPRTARVWVPALQRSQIDAAACPAHDAQPVRRRARERLVRALSDDGAARRRSVAARAETGDGAVLRL